MKDVSTPKKTCFFLGLTSKMGDKFQAKSRKSAMYIKEVHDHLPFIYTFMLLGEQFPLCVISKTYHIIIFYREKGLKELVTILIHFILLHRKK